MSLHSPLAETQENVFSKIFNYDVGGRLYLAAR